MLKINPEDLELSPEDRTNSTWALDHWDELVRNYPGETVAIRDGALIDHAPDFATLDGRNPSATLLPLTDETREAVQEELASPI